MKDDELTLAVKFDQAFDLLHLFIKPFDGCLVERNDGAIRVAAALHKIDNIV